MNRNMKTLRTLITLVFAVLCFGIAQAETSIVQYSTVLEATPDIETGEYASGDVIGEAIPLANAVRDTARSATIVSVLLVDADTETIDITVVYFDSAPTVTDNAAFAPSDADAANIVCIVPLTNHTDWANNGISNPTERPICPYKLGRDRILYAVLVAGATVTYTGDDLTLKTGVLLD